jgi:hypothetical protein
VKPDKPALYRTGESPPAFWMNLQVRWDLYFTQMEEKKVLDGIQPYQPPLAGGIPGNLVSIAAQAEVLLDRSITGI